MFAKFGSQVTVLDHGVDFMRREDREVAAAVRALLEESGVEIVLDADVRGVHDGAESAVVDARVGEEYRQFEADAVLVAIGRRPATSELDLDAAGVAHDERGFVRVDDRLRTRC